MADFRKVTDSYSVSPQITPQDVQAAADQGFRLLINNRPDDEAPGQPAGAVIAEAAKSAGLDYVHIPVRGGPTPEQVEAQRSAVETAKGPVLAFCRTGTRSIITWSLGQAESGARSRHELVQLGAAAGYDLTGPLGA